MPRRSAFDISSSSSTLYEGPGIGDRFRWDSIRKFVLFASIYSSSVFNYDLFSKVCNKVPRFVDFVICELTIGINFMFMDTFIKQYTRRFDSIKYLNPLLKGISYGTFLQCFLWTLLHVVYLSDSARFLAAGIRDVPAWSECIKSPNSSCVPTIDVMLRCSQNRTTPFSLTSAEFNYKLVFVNRDRSTITLRLFVIGFVWLLVFAIGSMAEEILIKIFRLAFVCRIFFTLSTTICLLVSTSKSEVSKAISHILDVTTPISYPTAMRHVVYAYGIGFLGIYDFGAISPYTIIDIAILLFMVLFSIISLVTSWTLRLMYEVMKKCVEVDVKLTTHRFLHSALPLATQFLYVHKIYAINIFGDILMSNSCFVVIMVVTMSRFLHFEYRSVKPTYLIGILCCVGVCLSIPVVTLSVMESGFHDLVSGVDATMYFLSGLKSAIIMWVYGVKKFSNDINFWLGFKPTKFWITIWSLLPVALFYLFLHKLLSKTRSQNGLSFYSSVWFSLTCIVVILIEIKTVINYLMNNNFLGLFEAHKYYGPPDADDRKKRLNYNEVLRQRKCRHNCIVIDEWYDCDHHFLTASGSLHLGESSSEESLMDIYVNPDQPSGPVQELQE